jgi:hypothetical protein
MAFCAVAAGATPFPAEIELRSLLPDNGGDGSQGFVAEGIGAGDTGASVSSAGDVNDDGIDDLIIGAPLELNQGGRAYVVFGRIAGYPALFPLAGLLAANGGDGSHGFVVNPAGDDGRTGSAVAGGADVNGDGISDILIGAPYASPLVRGFAGSSFVVFGRSAFPAEFNLATLAQGDGTQGFALYGFNVNNSGRLHAHSGSAVSLPGDMNGDGFADVVIGAHKQSGRLDPPHIVYAGETYLVFGHGAPFAPTFDLAQLLPSNGGDGSLGSIFDGRYDHSESGTSVCGAGDIDDDGLPDLLIGAPRTTGADGSGDEAYVILGRPDGYPAQTSFNALLPGGGGDGTLGFLMRDAEVSDKLGNSVSGAGDVNGDGIDDFVVSAYDMSSGAEPRPENVYVVFGRGAGFPPLFDLGTLRPERGGDGSRGVVLEGDFVDWINTAAGIGDINGDGFGDVIVNAEDPPDDSDYNTGSCYVVFGRSDFGATFDLADLLASNGGDGSEGFVLIGGHRDRACGETAGKLDINGDGVSDLALGAKDALDGTGPGVVYVVYGRVSDSDGDGLADNADNCTQVANADQRDTDGDGFGNICDADLDNSCLVAGNDWLILRSRLGTPDPDADFDGDGIVGRSDVIIFFNSKALPPGPSGVPNICEP